MVGDGYDMEQPGWIWTHTGRPFWPLKPRAEDVHVLDIAHALSLQCRYGGQIRAHYSVAEHCVRVALLCSREHMLAGLLHDAAEAYLVDVPRPVKRGLGETWQAIEERVHRAICEAFDISPEIPEEVHRADNVLAVTEMRDLPSVPRPNTMHLRAHGVEPLEGVIVPFAAEGARRMYLDLFESLTGWRGTDIP